MSQEELVFLKKLVNKKNVLASIVVLSIQGTVH